MAMGISAMYAYGQLMIYKDWIEDIKSETSKNYADMDFENSDKWEEMGEIVQDIEKYCNDIIDDMEKIHFEE